MKKARRFTLLVLLMTFCLLLTACKTHVEGREYTIEYNSKTYEGKYTGTMDSGVPQDEGKFYFGNEGDPNYFIYDGTWEKGEMKGEGTLITNNYIVHFPENDYRDALDRIGEYNGTVKDGLADGEGSFSAVNDQNEHYVYTGEWKDGLWDGNGKQLYDDKDAYVYEGHFEKGNFKPTAAEYIRMSGTSRKQNPYTLSDEQMSFIDEHNDVFLEHKIDSVKDLIKDDFSLNSFKKNPGTDSPYFIKLSLNVFQVTEFSKKDTYGFGLTDSLMQDYDYNPYRLLYFGNSKKLTEGKDVTVTVMPLGYSTYETVAGDNPWAFVGWIVSID